MRTVFCKIVKDNDPEWFYTWGGGGEHLISWIIPYSNLLRLRTKMNSRMSEIGHFEFENNPNLSLNWIRYETEAWVIVNENESSYRRVWNDVNENLLMEVCMAVNGVNLYKNEIKGL